MKGLTTRDDPRTHIVMAAIVEFARAGLAGARIDAIAARAGVNKRMLYHHVGDKQQLFDAAVADCRARLLARLAADPQAAGIHADDWRVLCAAVAAGQAPVLEGPTGEAREALLVAVALELVGCLWPGLGAGLLGVESAGPAADERRRELTHRLCRLLEGPLSSKPRVKLKPALRLPI